MSVSSIAWGTNVEIDDEFELNESINDVVLKIEVTFSDNSKQTITVTAAMVSGFDTSTTGSKTLTVTYEGKSINLNYTVVDSSPQTHVHAFTSTAAKDATCTEAGNSAYWTCSKCGKYYSDANGTTEITLASTVIGATGHSLEHHARVDATCASAGSIEYWTCSKCGKYYSDANGTTEINEADTVLAKLVATHVAPVAATCLKAGNLEYWYYEPNNEYFLTEACTTAVAQSATVVSKLDHSYGDDGLCDNGCGLANYNVFTLKKNEISGGQFTIEVNLGTNVATSAFTVTVNYGNLTLVSSSVMSNAMKNTSTAGIVAITYAGTTNLTTDSRVALLTFEAPVAAGSSQISLSCSEIVSTVQVEGRYDAIDTHYGLGNDLLLETTGIIGYVTVVVE